MFSIQKVSILGLGAGVLAGAVLRATTGVASVAVSSSPARRPPSAARDQRRLTKEPDGSVVDGLGPGRPRRLEDLLNRGRNYTRI
jgi:hypothetical protein